MGFPTAFENFLFRGFNFWDRAKRSEYWWILPLLWIGIFAMLYLDLGDIWEKLQNYEKPSLNPLHYGSGLLFFVTLIPRYALTVRRLNDAGRSPKWALLPLKATIVAIWAVLGILSAALTAGIGSMSEMDGLAFALGIMSLTDGDSFWPAMFALAQSVDGSTVLDILRGVDWPSPAAIAGNISGTMAADPTMATAGMLIIGGLIFGPPIMMMIFVLFMVAPSKLNASDYTRGQAAFLDQQPRKARPEKSSAYAAYAILDKVHNQPSAEAAVARKAEVQSLYQSRVLRRPQTDQ
ncbi:DUF805 domain-containing protein [Loktanella sp. IMCC34160]|uniref:DUF805 domain-containing protein n=1 Tax=Loktanella sp. IMCC34160 TaxID=2510646 RepID=UPI00101D8D1A|nr:DUF805 domain-containing protein [Loktanella sp. IMCC34160]RYG90437.1 DUF805 domain-containing protein [Loktanella sp. IMCC34160]